MTQAEQGGQGSVAVVAADLIQIESEELGIMGLLRKSASSMMVRREFPSDSSLYVVGKCMCNV